MKNKLGLFDLDGTLFDTRRVNYEAYCNAINKCGYDIKIEYDFFCSKCNGRSYKVFLSEIIEGIEDHKIAKIHELKQMEYSKCLKFAKKNEILFSIIKLMKSDYYVGIVTTASKINVNDILKEFKELDTFDLIISGEDVEKCKPFPEGYIKAMEQMKINKDNTIIFEDSDVGIKAAIESGAKYVRVYGFS